MTRSWSCPVYLNGYIPTSLGWMTQTGRWAALGYSGDDNMCMAEAVGSGLYLQIFSKRREEKQGSTIEKDGEECRFFVLYYIKLLAESAPESFSISDGYPFQQHTIVALIRSYEATFRGQAEMKVSVVKAYKLDEGPAPNLINLQPEKQVSESIHHQSFRIRNY
ncbi:hypothetical protein Tco_0776686 [Tanacetum coccineum]